MIIFWLNGEEVQHTDSPEISLLTFLREEKNITSVKDDCSAQGACGACLVEIGIVPTAAAVANAFYQFDKIRRYSLPIKKKQK
jgi:aldehyde oxidoreductase